MSKAPLTIFVLERVAFRSPPDSYIGFVIAAHTADEARSMANGDWEDCVPPSWPVPGDKGLWIDPELSTCQGVGTSWGTMPTIILSSYYGG